MAQKKLLEARGLYTDPNLLSKVPEGALVQADNVIIDRDGVIESRRGLNQYANEFGIGTDRAKQLITYKDRILVHYNDVLLFNDNPHNLLVDGDLQAFSGSFNETETGLRIKAIESNRNLFFTTNDGIKKISARTADDFTTAADFIIDAGGVKALDVTGQLNTENVGFLPNNSKVAYRVVWGYRDNNDNLILGSPSSRLVVTNFNNVSANVDLEFVVPQDINTDFFYQVYRTAVFTTSGSLTLDDIDPGDEMQLVIEDFPSAAELTANLVSVTDIAPEDFRQGGTPLYTNPNSGEGIQQANEPPPKAKDLTLYQNTVFYANTEARARETISLLSVNGLVSGVSSITINDSVNPSQTYTFVGAKEDTTIDFSSYSGTVPTDLNGKYFLLNSASNKRKYYIWYDNTLTTQTLDLSGFVGTVPTDLDGKYVIFYTPTRSYYLWFDSTGSIVDPGTTNSALNGSIGIRVDTSGDATKADVAASIDTALTTQQPVFDDYDNNYTALDEFVTIDSESFDDTNIVAIENIQQGFVYSINTPTNDDPANTPGVNTDVVGRIGFRVNVSRNVTTLADVADATAAAILEQDSASDFVVDYTASNEDLTITNTNNGNTDDAVDSGIEGIGSGFSITVNTQGDGEDSGSNHVLLSAAPTPSQQIDETARSLVNIINKNSSDSVYAFYISGPNDLPGQILLETRDIGVNQFTITADNATTGALFNPALPPATGASPVTGEPETKANRLFFSKLQQPEAVPLVNFIDVGPQDKAISRVLALRESLFILKEDGVYRLTGLNGAFTVDLFDESTKIISPDTAVVLNNQIYCLTNQGVAVISDTGIEIISKQLDNVFQVITSSNYDFELTSFGVSYETDRAYWLWVPSNTNDTVATQAFRYNTFTNTWTRHPIAKTCGIVNDGDDKLYLGPADENFIERERKLFKRTDYADREFEISIPSLSVDTNLITLSQSNLAVEGDALVQTQYLTIKQYNQLLKKLDLDPSTENDYNSTNEAVAGDNLKLKLDSLALKLDADTGITQTDFVSAISDYSDTGATVTLGTPTNINSTGHNLQDGRIVTITNSTTTPNIDGTYVVTRVDADNFTIPITTTAGGTCDWTANVTTFEDIQGAFNTIVKKLNDDSSVIFSNYLESVGTSQLEVIVLTSRPNLPTVTVQFSLDFIEGPITLYKGISTNVVYAPETFGDPSVLKHIREGTIMFENANFTKGQVGYKSDLSPGFETIDFNRSGNGDWGFFIWSEQNWGGGFSGVPFRTYIPRSKMRCRFIQTQFIHNSAREKWAIFGISYTLRGISEKAYRN